MRPTLAQLEAFYWIGRLGSFHAAARHLHLTQPSISARVAELEGALGAQLFDRTRQRVQLTSRGRDILPSVERVLNLCDDIAQPQGGVSALRGLLRLGAVESVALFALPNLLPRLRAAYPDLKVELTLSIGSELDRKLHARELDMAILTDATPGDSIVIEDLGEIEYSWVAGAWFALPERELLPADLRDLPILTNPNPSTIFDVMTEWFRSGDVEPERVTVCNSLALMSKLVIAGSGLAILQPQILRSEIERGLIRLVPSRPAVQSKKMVVAYRDPRHSYRPLIEMVDNALHESGLLTLPAAAPETTPRR